MPSWSDRREQALSLALPYWSAGVALVFGLGFLLVAFPLSQIPGKGNWVLLSLVSLAAGAGAASAIRPDFETLPRTLATNQGARIGCRTGALTALLGGGILVMVTQVRGYYLDVKWLAAVMSILPSAVTGMIAGAWTARLRSVPDANPAPQLSPPLPQSWGWLILTVHLVLSGLGFLSPLFLPAFLRDRPRPSYVHELPVQPAPPPAPTPRPTPSVLPAAAPPFAYSKPEGLDTAPASRWEITRTESVEAIDVTQPLAVAPDGTSLAHVANQGGSTSLKVLELATRLTVADFTLSAAILRLVYSPNSKQLFAVVSDSRHPLRIFDLASRESLLLPRPREGTIPDAYVRWWEAAEVAFFISGQEPIVLDLSTLQFGAPGQSAFWKSLTQNEQKRLPDEETSPGPNSQWPFAFNVAPRSYRESYPSRALTWSAQNEGLFLATNDGAHSYQRLLPSVKAAPGDHFIYPPGSGILLRVHGSGTEIFYFGLRSAPQLRFKLTMPWAIATSPDSEGLADKVAARQLCAFICDPLINPWNSNVIAPDRDRPKALARFSEWKENEAQLWITEEYRPLAPTDVIGDLHVWENGEMKPAGPSIGQEWWTPLPATAFSEGAPESVPVPVRHEQPALLVRGAVVMVERSKSQASATPSAKPFRDAETSSGASRPATSKPLWDPVEEAVREFVRLHHRKASQGDVAGVVADYADVVDHFTHGLVNRDFILRDERAYHAKLSSDAENIEDPIKVDELERGLYEAKYALVVRWSKPNGQGGGGVFDVTLHLRTHPNGFQITYHRQAERP